MQQPDPILSYFAQYIQTQLGIIYAEHNYFQLRNRLEEIAKLLNEPDLNSLHTRATQKIDGSFKQLLLDIATNNETSFFRDAKVFEAFKQSALDPLAAIDSPRPLKIWSAASSSGQEALSITMTILEWNKLKQKNVDFQIIGTDISSRILDRAKAAEYSQLEVQRGLPAPLMVKYFTKNEKDLWKAKPELTKHIQYLPLNLKERFPFVQKFDVIFCRNVLIYQSVASKTEIIQRLTAQLEPGGFLILGTAEGLIGISSAFEAVTVAGSVIYKLKPSVKKAA